MLNARTPTLRQTTRNPKTGEVIHRKLSGHITNTPETNSPSKDPQTPPRGSTNIKPSTTNMPVVETQTETPHQPKDEELHQKMDKLADRFENVEKKCDDYKTSLEFTQEEVKDLRDENIALKESLRDLSLEIQRNTYAIQKLSANQENMETNMRKRNLIFEGIPEMQAGRENLHATVCQIFTEMEIEKPIDYDAAYRIGSKQGKYPRQLLISFIRQDDRDMVYLRRMRLSKSQHFKRVWVSEDVTPRTRRARNVIREVAKEARNNGARCQATPSSVTINEVKYTEENLEDLPSQFAAEKTKMKKIGDTIAYGSEHAPLSNLYPATVPIKKRNYLSSEQAFRHIRATENKQHNIAARILWSRDPYDIMALDRNMAVTEEWKKKEDLELFKCMFRKYEANEDLRELLLSTGDMELAEATGSKKWATGASLNSAAMKTHTWTGENKQGKHNMKIREYFKLNRDEYEGVSSPDPVSDSYLDHLYKEA